jgi:arsenate reductase-like glutaredoxin family protein
METKILIYTTDGCLACQTMKTALERLRVQYTEIRLKNGMTVPPDVRSIPTLAAERDGKRTTICKGWPGSIKNLKKLLEASKNNRL